MLLFVVCVRAHTVFTGLFYRSVWVCVYVYEGAGRHEYSARPVRSLPFGVHGEVILVETVNILCACKCVCVRQSERGTAVGLCPGLQGGMGTTLTHTVLLLSLLFYPSHDPSLFLLSFLTKPFLSFLPALVGPSSLVSVFICSFGWDSNKAEERNLASLAAFPLHLYAKLCQYSCNAKKPPHFWVNHTWISYSKLVFYHFLSSYSPFPPAVTPRSWSHDSCDAKKQFYEIQ